MIEGFLSLREVWLLALFSESLVAISSASISKKRSASLSNEFFASNIMLAVGPVLTKTAALDAYSGWQLTKRLSGFRVSLGRRSTGCRQGRYVRSDLGCFGCCYMFLIG